MIPMANASVKCYDGRNKRIYLLLKIITYLKNIILFWDNFSTDTKDEFDRECVYEKIIFQKEIKSNGDEVTDFYDKEISKMESCLAVTSMDSALKKDENDYLQVFLKKCEYVEKKDD